ncbi:serine/threonine-protein kinase/endoribonuclease IRE1a [Tanacetum coccineum]
MKKVLKDKDNDYSETLEFYRQCHDLNGVVRLEIAESFNECHYLAFPVCMGNLEAVFRKVVMGVFKNERELVNLMRGLVLAVYELHNFKEVLHRNLNPWNVLVQKTYRGYEIKLCGLRKTGDNHLKLEFQTLVDYRGTIPYKSEMRDLGETLLYIIRLGAYEFKDKGPGYYEELVNSGYVFPRGTSIQGLSTLRSEYSHVVNFLMDTKNSLFLMSSVDLEAVLALPYFWEAEKKMDLIRATCDLLLDLATKKLESNNTMVFSGDWSIKVNKDWFDSMKVTKDGITHDYKTDTMRDLIKITRNSINHSGKIPLGTDRITLEAYLAKTWPLFFFHVYQYAFSVCPEGSPTRQKYFP